MSIMKKSRIFLAGLAVAGLVVLNFTHSDAGAVSHSQASAVTSAGTIADEEPVNLRWSYPIKCRKMGKRKNSYQVCMQNGPANPCDTENATTCTCGKNCK